jgi:hypothetical protein
MRSRNCTHNSAGATRAEDAPLTEIDAIVEVEVDIDDLFFETTRESDGGDIEVFYLIDPGGGCRVTVISVEPWQRTRVTPASEPTPRQPPDNPSS